MMNELTQSGLIGYRELMLERLTRHCGYDTSSLTEEHALSAMRAANYVVRVGQAVSGSNDARECFEAGCAALHKRLERARDVLKFVRASAPKVDNIAFKYTLGAGLDTFFNYYDIELFADDIPAEIDYPLCLPISNKLKGLDYIEEYLRRLTYENMYLERFSLNEITLCLRKRFASSRELIINIFETVLSYQLTQRMLDADPNRDLAEQVEWTAQEMSSALPGAAGEYLLNSAREVGRVYLASVSAKQK